MLGSNTLQDVLRKQFTELHPGKFVNMVQAMYLTCQKELLVLKRTSWSKIFYCLRKNFQKQKQKPKWRMPE